MHATLELTKNTCQPLDHSPESGHNGRSPVDTELIEKSVRTILRAVGEDPNRPGLLETPRRVARMYVEMFSGLHQDPAKHLAVAFPEQYDEMVLVRDIRFTNMCEHHLLPFGGVAQIAYVPNGHVVGLSKLARIVEVISHRPQVQETDTSVVVYTRNDWIADIRRFAARRSDICPTSSSP